MKIATYIGGISLQLSAVCARVCSLSEGIDACKLNEDPMEMVYHDQLLDEVRHLQILTLELTKKVSGIDEIPEGVEADGHEDGEGVFAEGELTQNIGEKEEDEPDKTSI